jgi:hypothetical protein
LARSGEMFAIVRKIAGLPSDMSALIDAHEPFDVVAVGAHPDDIEIVMGTLVTPTAPCADQTIRALRRSRSA